MFKTFGRARVLYGGAAILVHLLLYSPFLNWANRIEPWVAGIPFFLVYLWGVYVVIWIIMILGSLAVDKEVAE